MRGQGQARGDSLFLGWLLSCPWSQVVLIRTEWRESCKATKLGQKKETGLGAR